MNTKVYFGIAWRIIALFTAAMLFTYLPEHLRDFFGDCPVETIQETRGEYTDTKFVYCGNIDNYQDEIDPEWGWGVRHYWYAWMTGLLFLLSMVSVIISIVNLISKAYNIKL